MLSSLLQGVVLKILWRVLSEDDEIDIEDEDIDEDDDKMERDDLLVDLLRP